MDWEYQLVSQRIMQCSAVHAGITGIVIGGINYRCLCVYSHVVYTIHTYTWVKKLNILGLKEMIVLLALGCSVGVYSALFGCNLRLVYTGCYVSLTVFFSKKPTELDLQPVHILLT